MDKPTSNSSGPESESLVAFYLGVIRRRFWVIIPIVVVFGTLGLIRAFRTPPRYEATAKLIVEPAAKQVMSFENKADDGSSAGEDFYNTQTALLRSQAVLELALREDRVRRYLEEEARRGGENASFRSELRRSFFSLFGATPAPPPALWERLGNHINAVHIKNSQLIELTLDFEAPYQAARMANVVAQAYDDYHRLQQSARLSEDFLMLQDQKTQIQESLRKAEEELQAFRESSQGVTVSALEANDPASDRLVKINAQLTEVQLARIELSSQLGVMNSAYRAEGPEQRANGERLFALPIIQSDKALADFRQSIALAEKELSTVAQVYGVKHPLYEEADARWQLLREQFRKALNEVILAHASQLKMLENQENELQARYEEQKQVVLSLSKESFELTRLLNEVARYQLLFDKLVERIGQVDISSGLIRTNVQIIEEAPVPIKAAGGGKLQAVLLAICLGLFFGVGLAFLFENLDDSIRTPEDLKERLNAPLLGLVPTLTNPNQTNTNSPTTEHGDPFSPGQVLKRIALVAKRVGQRFSSDQLTLPTGEADQVINERRAYSATLMLTEPNSSPAESYRAIRANLFYSRPAGTIKTLCITSSRPQEGKTTTSCNLAIAIAQTGKKVLLIDADLHRPQIARALGLTGTAGLSSVLVGEAEWRKALQKIDIKGATVPTLDILGAGPASPSPSELLGSTRMREFLDEVKPVYDWVIIDTPPVLFVSDTAAMGVHCDGLLLVVKSGDSSRALLTRAVESLTAVRITLLGAVLNNVMVSKVGRYYSTYYHVGYSRYARDYKRTYYASDTDADVASIEKTAIAPQIKTPPAQLPVSSVPAVVAVALPALQPEPAKTTAPQSAALASTPPAVATPATWLDELSFRPILRRVQQHLAAGRRKEARDELQRLIERRTRNAGAWETYLELAAESNDAAAIQQGVAYFGGNASTDRHLYALSLGHLAFVEKDFNLAERYYREALSNSPKNAAVITALARLAATVGDRTKLREYADLLVSSAPSNAYGHYIQACLGFWDGNQVMAEKELRKSLTLRQTPEALNDLSALLAKNGMLAEAEKTIRTALAIDQQNPLLWTTLGNVMQHTKRLPDATAALEQALTLRPQHASTLLALIELHGQQGHAEKVRELDKQIVACKGRLTPEEAVRLGSIRKQFKSG